MRLGICGAGTSRKRSGSGRGSQGTPLAPRQRWRAPTYVKFPSHLAQSLNLMTARKTRQGPTSVSRRYSSVKDSKPATPTLPIPSFHPALPRPSTAPKWKHVLTCGFRTYCCQAQGGFTQVHQPRFRAGRTTSRGALGACGS